MKLKNKIKQVDGKYFIYNTETKEISAGPFEDYEDAYCVLSLNPSIRTLEYLLNKETAKKLTPLYEIAAQSGMYIDKT